MDQIKKIINKGALLLGIGLFLECSGCATGSGCSISPTIISQVSAIRGLEFQEPVSCRVATEEQIKKHLHVSFEKNNPAERLYYEESVWKLLGLLPSNYSYKKGILALYTERIAGYYDPLKEQYVMPEDTPKRAAKKVIIHELTHALQDQYYDLEAFTEGDFSSDELLSRLSFIEGDAQLVLYRSLKNLSCLPASKTADDEFLSRQKQRMFYEVVQGEVQIFEWMMSFPYTYGLEFVCTLRRELEGAEYERVFSNPPQSTGEILHPQRYLERIKNNQPSGARVLSELENPLFKDSLGEFLIASFLATYIDDHRAFEIAEGLRGDRVTLSPTAGEYSVLWITLWSTNDKARKFYEAMEEVMKKIEKQETHSKKEHRVKKLSMYGEKVSLVVTTPTLPHQ